MLRCAPNPFGKQVVDGFRQASYYYSIIHEGQAFHGPRLGVGAQDK